MSALPPVNNYRYIMVHILNMNTRLKKIDWIVESCQTRFAIYLSRLCSNTQAFLVVNNPMNDYELKMWKFDDTTTKITLEVRPRARLYEPYLSQSQARPTSIILDCCDRKMCWPGLGFGQGSLPRGSVETCSDGSTSLVVTAQHRDFGPD